MTNAYQTAQNLGLTGTPQQIVDQLKATGLTARPILLANLLDKMNIPLGMLRRLPRQESDGSKWSGTAFNLILWINENGSQGQKDAINSWFSHITNDRNETFDTSVVEYGSQFWALANTFGGQPTFPSFADFAAVADLGGGWLFADLTAEQYAADKTAYELQQAAQSALAALQTRRQHWDVIAADIRSRIESGALVDDAAVVAAVTEAL
jgi:hypothetical protein